MFLGVPTMSEETRIDKLSIIVNRSETGISYSSNISLHKSTGYQGDQAGETTKVLREYILDNYSGHLGDLVIHLCDAASRQDNDPRKISESALLSILDQTFKEVQNKNAREK